MRTAIRSALIITAAALSLGACDNTNVFVGGGGGRPDAPRDLTATAGWVLEGFNGGSALGHPVVNLEWLPPLSWNREVFRIYGRRGGSSSYTLLATVTSCTVDGCAYADRNVSAGQTYDYYVATYDQASGIETATDFSETAAVPTATRPAAPVADSVIGLDHAAYIRWHANGSTGALWKYLVYLTHVGTQASLYQAGETDGTAYLDSRVENGSAYGYRVAAMDTFGRVSDLSAEITGVARPDAHGELLYAFGDSAAASGFRFVSSEASLPIVAGGSTQAQWRLESDAAGWRIVPLNGTRVLEYPGRTTSLVCGPAADATCRAVTRAPATGYTTAAIPVNSEFSYVFAVTGSDARTHYGVARVQLLGSDGRGHRLMIFDWAYQLLADEPRLDRTPAH
ncbi:MAG TPA: hypothetical protein VFE05_02560 [Longimicrobiaceae bacterium]|jgi:hypothetical protein|nr:hypothetical protein [Longimicrobiaceae bacterium]